jgi:flagellin-like hook-associated protein FlgL
MFDINGEGIKDEAADQILAEIEKQLYKMRSLAIYAAQNDLSNEQRAWVQTRIDEIKKEIDGIAAMLIPPGIPVQ